MEEQVEMVGRAFVDHYYHLFDNDRSSLSSLYQSDSMLTFEGQKVLGVEDISSKLNELQYFDECKRVISTIDSQPMPSSGILVFVSGSLQLPGQELPSRFTQMFHLIPTPQGNFYLHNDIFRVNHD